MSHTREAVAYCSLATKSKTVHKVFIFLQAEQLNMALRTEGGWDNDKI